MALPQCHCDSCNRHDVSTAEVEQLGKRGAEPPYLELRPNMHLITTHKLDAGASPVHTVTVFQSDCAEVVRKFTTALKAGDNVVEISHLPHTMQTESLRVAGIGQAMLSDVVCIMPKSRTSKFGHDGKSEELLKLEEEKALLMGQKRVIDYQATILVNYSRTMTSEHVSPDDMLTFLQSFTAMGEQNTQADVAYQKSLREIEKKIAKEIDDPAIEHDNSHLRNIKVKLTINAEESHAAEISLTYLVKRASWSPVFDLRAVTDADGKPTTKLALHYRATVNQSTGEDWTEAVLILSTASPDSLGSHIPNLIGMKITPRQWPGGGFFRKQDNRLIAPNPFLNNNTNNFTTKQASQSLFGPTLQQQQQSAFTGFGQPAQQPQPLGLFGSPNPPASSGPFGQAASTNPAPTTTVGFTGFGIAPASIRAPVTSLFGSSPGLSAATRPFEQAASTAPAPNTTGGFGAASIPASSAVQTTSSYGSSTHPVINAPPATEDFVHVAPDEDGAYDPEALPEMEFPSAATKENSMAANFEVKGNGNIRSDGSNHKVAIAVLNFDAKIQTVVVPRSVPGANLHCTIHNSSKDTHLLPGSMAVYLDEGYITNTAVPHVSPGDSFKCSLGRDHSVGVTFDQKSKLLATTTNLFSANRETVLCTVRIMLKNKRDSQIKGLIVRDIVPVSDTELIKVVLTKPAGLAEAEEGKEVEVEDGVTIKWCESKGEKGGMKEGQLQWTVDLDKRETKLIVLEWEVISPPGRQWGYEFHSASRV